MRRALGPLVIALVVVAVVLGLSQAHDGGGAPAAVPRAPTLAEARRALAGSPAPLARLHADANRLEDVPLAARLHALRGFPVVVNKWASWCRPCRDEFPVFARVAAADGRRVGFLGLNAGHDQRADARAFLAREPVAYPHVYDPKGRAVRSIEAGQSFPTTVFIDRHGGIAFTHQGPYLTDRALERDIRRYLGA